MLLPLSALLLITIVFGRPAHAYQEIAVTEGGTLTGSVRLEGPVPKPKGYNLTTLPDPFYCGRISDGQGWRILQPFNVGPAGEFRDVVVYLEGIEQGKPFADGGGAADRRQRLPVPPVHDRRAGRSIGDGGQHGPGHARHSSL